jgi:hypothetical protein
VLSEWRLTRNRGGKLRESILLKIWIEGYFAFVAIIMNRNEKTVPDELAMKVCACSATLYLPMVICMKYLSPLLYGLAATPEIIYRTEITVVMPCLMIGMGFVALRAQNAPLKKLVVRCLISSIAIAFLGAAAGVPIFRNG